MPKRNRDSRFNKSKSHAAEPAPNLRKDFNFLENLLAFCTHKSRSVPEESGVHFQIDPAIQGKGICLLFHIDRPKDKLILEGPRPDYLVLFASSNECIFTIVEMKGRDEKEGRHAIEQIKALRDRIKQELQTHLSQRVYKRIHYQGILLTPSTAQVPLKQLEEERRKGLSIFSIRWSHQAQLHDYVCKLNALDGEPYKHKNAVPRPNQPDLDWLHQLLIKGALNGRVDDAFRAERTPKHRDHSGVYINYEHPEAKPTGYAALSLCSDSEAVAFSDDALKRSTEKALANLGFTFHTKIFQTIASTTA